MQDVLNELRSEGFVEIETGGVTTSGVMNKSCSAAQIYFSHARNQVAKVAHDPAYSVFVKWAMANSTKRVPKFIHHEEGGNPDTYDYFTYTRMERLEELTPVEQQNYRAWYDRIIARVIGGEDLQLIQDDDPFGLISTFRELWAIAADPTISANNMIRGIDLGKSENLMARLAGQGRSLLYTDPYN